MLETFEKDSALEVRFSQYWFAILFLFIPLLLIIEQGPPLLAGELTSGEKIGLFLGFLLPSTCAYFLIEFAEFRFSRRDNLFSWRWRNLFKKDSGQVELNRVVKIRRDAMEANDLIGWENSYRLIAILDDGKTIPLTRSYSGQHHKKLDEIVDQLRDYLGHFEPLK